MWRRLAERDVNGILWERFTADQQAEEIRQIWPSMSYQSNVIRMTGSSCGGNGRAD